MRGRSEPDALLARAYGPREHKSNQSRCTKAPGEGMIDASMARALVSAAALVLLAAGCSDRAQESALQTYADALAQGDGRGACRFLAAEQSMLETRCTEHLAWMRANAPWFAGAKVRVLRSRTDEGDTRLLSTVRATSGRGSGELSFKLSCEAGRFSYPMASCAGPSARAGHWIFAVSATR